MWYLIWIIFHSFHSSFGSSFTHFTPHLATHLVVSLVGLQIFLSLFNAIERATNRSSTKQEKKKPGWITSYNFASLLNVPNALDQFGPLVDLWEGKNQGEGIVKFIKHDMGMGLRQGWPKHLLEKLLVRKGLSASMGSLEDWFQDILSD